jgi:hypothetical protein
VRFRDTMSANRAHERRRSVEPNAAISVLLVGGECFLVSEGTGVYTQERSYSVVRFQSEGIKRIVVAVHRAGFGRAGVSARMGDELTGARRDPPPVR